MLKKAMTSSIFEFILQKIKDEDYYSTKIVLFLANLSPLFQTHLSGFRTKKWQKIVSEKLDFQYFMQ